MPLAAEDIVVTERGRVLGTLAYMSPEQARGEPASAASDMYSFGLLLQELLTGEAPYEQGLSQIALLAAAAEARTRPVKGVSADFAALIERLKSPAPTRRPTAVETAERLRWIRNKPKRRLRAVAAAGIVLALAAGGIKYTLDLDRERTVAEQRRDQAEGLIGFMLGDLREKLKPIGRLDILDGVGDEALDYFAAVPEAELSSEELFRRATALSQIGDVRIEQGKLEAAMEPIQESLALSKQLVARDPQNAQWQLGLGASHYYIGAVLMNRGEPRGALEHWEAYHSIASALAAKDPVNTRYRSELFMAGSNLGAAYQAQGELESARARFDDALKAAASLAATDSKSRRRQIWPTPTTSSDWCSDNSGSWTRRGSSCGRRSFCANGCWRRIRRTPRTSFAWEPAATFWARCSKPWERRLPPSSNAFPQTVRWPSSWRRIPPIRDGEGILPTPI